MKYRKIRLLFYLNGPVVIWTNRRAVNPIICGNDVSDHLAQKIHDVTGCSVAECKSAKLLEVSYY